MKVASAEIANAYRRAGVSSAIRKAYSFNVTISNLPLGCRE